MYQTIRNVNNKWQPRTAIKEESGKMLMKKLKVIQRWAIYWSELCKTQTNQTVTTAVIKELRKISTAQNNIGKDENNILIDEIKRAINRLKNIKRPGNNGITAEMIKSDGYIVLKIIHKICNNVGKRLTNHTRLGKIDTDNNT